MNTESTLEDSLSGDYLYAQVTELIGELSWGIGLPTVMNVGIIDPLTKEVQRIAVSGTSQKPYFAVIYDKVRANIKYNPLKTERDRVYRLEQQNAELLAALKACQIALEPWDDEKPRDYTTDRYKLRAAHKLAVEAIAKDGIVK